MPPVTHYERLGVGPGATKAEIREAYLAAARRAHPDVAGRDDDTMRDLNEAWSVLGDAVSRAEYDLTLSLDAEPPRTRIERPEERPFVPFHAYDEDDDDTWRYTDDPVDPDTAPGMLQQLGPIGLVVAGFLLAVVGAVVKLAPLAALGGVLVIAGFAAFVVVPLVVMGRARAMEDVRRRGVSPGARPKSGPGRG